MSCTATPSHKSQILRATASIHYCDIRGGGDLATDLQGDLQGDRQGRGGGGATEEFVKVQTMILETVCWLNEHSDDNVLCYSLN